MSYRLRPDERLADSIYRIASERIDRAVHELDPAAKDQAERVHNARKQIKMVRAVLRLVRDEIGDEVYALENICFRNAARELSAVRDSAAMVESLDKLLDWVDTRPGRAALEATRERTAAIQHEAGRHKDDHEQRFATVSRELLDARDRVKLWPIERNDFRALRGGLLATYRNSRDLFAEALEDSTPEVMHEWRKQVKYLWNQIRILRPLWPDALRTMSRELHQLSDFLGDYHDLVTLRSLLQVRPDLAIDDGGLELCVLLIDERRAELEQRAFTHGARFFAEKPKAFARRIASYWKLWSRENGVES